MTKLNSPIVTTQIATKSKNSCGKKTKKKSNYDKSKTLNCDTTQTKTVTKLKIKNYDNLISVNTT